VIVTEYVPAVLTVMQAVLAVKLGPAHEYVAPTRLVAQNWAVCRGHTVALDGEIEQAVG